MNTKRCLICIGLRERTMVVSAIPTLLLVMLRTHGKWLTALGRWLLVSTDPHATDVVVMLGGGGPERLDDGIAAYHAGAAERCCLPAMRQFQ
jgi:hypothetical protein